MESVDDHGGAHTHQLEEVVAGTQEPQEEEEQHEQEFMNDKKEEESQQKLSPWDRLYEEGLRREMRRLEMCEKAMADRLTRSLFGQQQEQIQQQQQQHPSPTERGNVVWTNDFNERQQKWLEECGERVQQLREAAELAELSRLQPPTINESSRRMTMKAGYEGPIRGWEEHFARYVLRSSPNRPSIPAHMFRPNINLNACRSTGPDADVVERLYSDDEKRRQRLNELISKYRREELIDNSTGKPYFKPHSLYRTGNIAKDGQNNRSAAEAAETLYLKALEQRDKHKALLEEAHEQHSFSPYINERSRKMAIKRKTKEEKKQNVISPPVITPKKKSKINMGDFLLREAKCLERRRQKMQEVGKLLLEKEQQECTFNPRISKKSVEIFEGSQHRFNSHSPLQDIVQLQNINQMSPAEEDFNLYQEEVPVYDVSSPSLYNSKPVSNTMTSSTDNDNGSQLINEFEQKMKELLDEWRSLEHV
ncbi:uncharacterized protein TM35_000102330 [Trypanosoma theileri]|uniref:Uncharacterized protein n=1 Tax=Trypanosoma theileri TaxID=67003 RepID=A0A1X0NZ54_9TRYP|nr:uncharacterized protein TM35_000102330 [Trypanosoma theileri]ORC89965.1 hypothetical protein TM35_000102330 [Trypanosoma theileri]